MRPVIDLLDDLAGWEEREVIAILRKRKIDAARNSDDRSICMGLKPVEYASREKAKRRAKAKMMREKAIAALRENRTIAIEIEPSTGRRIVEHHGDRACQVERAGSRITLPFVSIQHRPASVRPA